MVIVILKISKDHFLKLSSIMSPVFLILVHKLNMSQYGLTVSSQ